VATDLFPKLFGGRVLPAVSNSSAFALEIRSRSGQQAELQFQAIAGGVSTLAVSPRGRTKRVAGALRATLARIARSARNIRAVALPATVTHVVEPPIALTRFAAPDGSATAQVPVEAAWAIDGAKGAIDGHNPSRGEFELGLNAPIITPEADPYHLEPGYEADYETAADAIRNAWPALRSSVYPIGNVQILSTVPGTVGTFGPGWDSAMFELSFSQDGAA
jgi:hypothetical protein